MLIRILIDLRDFSYQYCKKAYGPERAKSEYVLKLFGFLVLYYASFLLLLTHLAVYFNRLPRTSNPPFLIRLALGALFVIYPMYKLIQYILNKLDSIASIPETISAVEYKRKRATSLLMLAIGIVVFLASLTVPIYLMGGEIELGSYVLRRY